MHHGMYHPVSYKSIYYDPWRGYLLTKKTEIRLKLDFGFPICLYHLDYKKKNLKSHHIFDNKIFHISYL